MVVRQRGDRTQIAVLEDDILVEHYVTKASSTSYAGNVYLGRVQNVLPSMEAAFVDIGKGRNAVLYAGEVNWDVAGLEGQARSIEHALKSGDNILVQVTKDPIGHKGARLTSQISLPGPLPRVRPERLDDRHQPQAAGHRAGPAEGHPAPDRAGRRRRDHPYRRRGRERGGAHPRRRAAARRSGSRSSGRRRRPSPRPPCCTREPDLELRVVRDVFNEDFTKLVVSGDDAWEMISQYVDHVAPDLLPRLDEVDRRGRRVPATCASTSSCSRGWTARSGCPPAARWSSTAPRR